MSGHIAMVALVDSEEAEEMRWNLVCRRARLPLPKEGVKIVCLNEDCPLPNIEGLCQGFQMQEPPRQLEVRIGDVTIGVYVGH